jgi:hypothetical protein
MRLHDQDEYRETTLKRLDFSTAPVVAGRSWDSLSRLRTAMR